ncbi:hypothetical protein [Stenotrophomonas lactitubi]|nr:hypothetical protein [Stenotrophomonas lactitubi]
MNQPLLILVLLAAILIVYIGGAKLVGRSTGEITPPRSGPARPS